MTRRIVVVVVTGMVAALAAALAAAGSERDAPAGSVTYVRVTE